MQAVAKRQCPVEIVITPQGVSVIWKAEQQPAVIGKRTVISQQTMSLIRALKEDGETYASIVSITGISKTNVFRVLKGEYALTANRWNV